MKTVTDGRRSFLTGTIAGGIGAILASGCAPAAKSGKKRIMVGSLSHETNTFNPNKTTLDMLKSHARLGADVLRRGGGMVHGTYGDCIGGFIDVLDMYDIELVGSVRTGGGGGIVTADAFDWASGIMLETLDKTPVDAVYLSLHGGGVSENHPDMEGELLQIIRKKVGPGVPIMFTMDLHSKPTKLMTEVADAVSIYRTYPHIDAFECGLEIGTIMAATLTGKVKPVMAVKKLPLMIGPPLNVVTSDMPIKLVYDRAKQIQRNEPGILTVCPGHGFMQQDTPAQGAGVLVTADNDRASAQKFADEVGDLMFKYRKDYWVHLPFPDETIRMALDINRKTGKPVAVADGGDNMGAGTPGDGTALLAEILKQRVKSAFVQLWDPESAKKAADAGAGAKVTLDVGGKSDKIYGPPVSITGKVAAVSDFSGKDKPAALIDLGSGVQVLVNTADIGPNDQSNLKAIGVDPSKFAMVICKGGFAFRPQYPSSVYEYIMSNTPGYASVDLKQFTFTKIPRPIYPLDDI